MKNIGVDIGGTFIKLAIVDEGGKVIFSSKTPTPDGTKIPQRVVDSIVDLCEKAGEPLADISSVGIGTTGVCDSKAGVVVNGANIPNYKDVHICEFITEKLGKPSYVDNDANCAALGEYMLSDSKSDSFIFITLGTGVGGGIILDGKILRGINSAAGEIGHITLVKNGEKCNCGRRGCWERYASVSALVRQTKAAGFKGDVTGKTVFEHMEKGNSDAKAVFDAWVEYVSEGICDMINIFQPQLIVIGGGVSHEGDKLLNPVRRFIENNVITGKLNLKQTEIAVSKLFNDAGVVGASFLYTQK